MRNHAATGWPPFVAGENARSRANATAASVNAAQLELSRFLQPAQAQAGLNVNQGQLANQNWANLAQTLLGNYQTNVQNAAQQNAANQQAYLNQASQQGYQNLMPTVQNIASQLSGSAPAGGQELPGYMIPGMPATTQPGTSAYTPQDLGGGQGWSTYI